MIAVFNRITSYNVCYTKLLCETFIVPATVKVDQALDNIKLGGSSVYTQNCSPITLAAGAEQTVSFPAYVLSAANDLYEITVITSYSIHYTKLYEEKSIHIRSFLATITDQSILFKKPTL